ncbi:copper resistance protein CopC [Streptomyces sp. NPDC059590]|uniref:copper resistance CopC family protein n=1 Tax=Streptomyces sp. NPDC059590 TaxID=3346877 RepID=UPI0036C7FD2B
MSIARITRAAAVSGLLICAAPVAVATAPPAAAHTGLTGSAPDDGATVATSPARVSLSFNDPMDARYSRVAVTGASGRSVTTGAPKVDGRTVSQALTAELPAGRYTVGYRVISADGHPVSGSYTFTVAAARTTAPVPRPSRRCPRAGGCWRPWRGWCSPPPICWPSRPPMSSTRPCSPMSRSTPRRGPPSR